MIYRALVCAVTCLLLLGLQDATLAEGNETLGAPNISIESGTNLLAAGTGLVSQPGTINLDVPGNVSVKQVILYWQGRGVNPAPTEMATVNGNSVTGVLIGTGGGDTSHAYRVDITNLDLVSPGPNSLTVDDVVFDARADGAMVLVVVDDGSAPSVFAVRDGLDYAWVTGPADALVTLPQTFDFAPSDVERNAKLLIGLGDGTPSRQDRVDITLGNENPTVLCNSAIGRDGAEWDTIVFPATIPPNQSSLTIQLFSEQTVCPALEESPDSLSWTIAALSIESPPDEAPGECWLTAGGTKFENVTLTWNATAKSSNGRGPRDSVGGVALPSCSEFPSNGGNWNHVSHANKLHLLGKDIRLVRCGNVDGIEPGSESPVCAVNFIEFTGTGTLRGIKGNHMDPVPVSFFVRGEDHNEPGNEQAADSGVDIDRYFLRVEDEDGNLRLLVDSDGVDDGSVDPLTITGGNFQIHCTSCD